MSRPMKYVTEVLEEGNYRELDAAQLKKVFVDWTKRITECEALEERSKKRVMRLTDLVIDYLYQTTTEQSNGDGS